jgi:hypothetical protein
MEGTIKHFSQNAFIPCSVNRGKARLTARNMDPVEEEGFSTSIKEQDNEERTPCTMADK